MSNVLKKLPAPLDAKLKKLGWEYGFSCQGRRDMVEDINFMVFYGYFQYTAGEPAPFIEMNFQYSCDETEQDILVDLASTLLWYTLDEMNLSTVEHALQKEYPNMNDDTDTAFILYYDYIFKYMAAVHSLVSALSDYAMKLI
jgi:hypothetical protein